MLLTQGNDSNTTDTTAAAPLNGIHIIDANNSSNIQIGNNCIENLDESNGNYHLIGSSEPLKLFNNGQQTAAPGLNAIEFTNVQADSCSISASHMIKSLNSNDHKWNNESDTEMDEYTECSATSHQELLVKDDCDCVHKTIDCSSNTSENQNITEVYQESSNSCWNFCWVKVKNKLSSFFTLNRVIQSLILAVDCSQMYTLALLDLTYNVDQVIKNIYLKLILVVAAALPRTLLKISKDYWVEGKPWKSSFLKRLNELIRKIVFRIAVLYSLNELRQSYNFTLSNWLDFLALQDVE